MATRWLEKALSYDGLKEIPGVKDHPKIIEWHKLCGVPNPTDEIAWCASFVSGVLEECGVLGPRSASSQAFLDWGDEAEELEPGVIVVFRGHVAIVESLEPELMIIGGNQSEGVCIQPARYYGEIMPGGMRWPAENIEGFVEAEAEVAEEAPPVLAETPVIDVEALIRDSEERLTGRLDNLEKLVGDVLKKMSNPAVPKTGRLS